jgi:hypothetical protein
VPVLSSRPPRQTEKAAKCLEPLCPTRVLPPLGRRDPSPGRTLLLRLRSSVANARATCSRVVSPTLRAARPSTMARYRTTTGSTRRPLAWARPGRRLDKTPTPGEIKGGAEAPGSRTPVRRSIRRAQKFQHRNCGSSSRHWLPEIRPVRNRTFARILLDHCPKYIFTAFRT